MLKPQLWKAVIGDAAYPDTYVVLARTAVEAAAIVNAYYAAQPSLRLMSIRVSAKQFKRAGTNFVLVHEYDKTYIDGR